MTCKWVFVLSIDVYFYWLEKIIENSNRLVTACIAKTATGIQCLGKSVTVFVFIRLPSVFLFYVRRNQLENLEFKTTRVEDTILILAVIPFQVGVNNSLFSFGWLDSSVVKCLPKD